ncbi:hypothetical protein QBC46DRAFT_406675 [Diplogelasinospora grovesii]|uniref:Uncharacterized protein n=1 Tax=Diplogelasinospora grovesii TaxID=303347 RepID=A0AAN6NA34_9PEZI|nr:hypothetical protein QBC46DRAFT_406675 [Diplogelasinospora grovesii]
MSGQRTYYLPPSDFSGTVDGVRISYNDETINALVGIENDELKRAMEDMAVQAALERGFDSVQIRSIPHSWTITRSGKKVNDGLHMTVSAGKRELTAHIYCSGVNPRRSPSRWYDALHNDHVKCEDRATSPNSSGGSRPPSAGRDSPSGSGGKRGQSGDSSSQAQESTETPPRWVPTGSNILGQRYRWWNGTEYPNHLC